MQLFFLPCINNRSCSVCDGCVDMIGSAFPYNISCGILFDVLILDSGTSRQTDIIEPGRVICNTCSVIEEAACPIPRCYLR